MKTFTAKPETVKRDWFVVDAAGKTLGRLATEIASRLRGKHKPEYTPHVDTGDYIVIINASQLKVTGTKNTDKVYYVTPVTQAVSLLPTSATSRLSSLAVRLRRPSRACCPRVLWATP